MVDLPQPTKCLVFNGVKWSWTIFPYLTEDASSGYYKVTSRAWKGKSWGVDCIGVSINKYEVNPAKILVQKVILLWYFYLQKIEIYSET
ncbi:hypothetical protein OQZ33_01115 [Pedobacter sp. MC2016-05]|uniref:hypothetical protein n=1 Tax=Pedobacter sp. MC2016-05 TaxID=2994474 RepID=UPI00224683F6|nr:hypothetical protein [Pedobacter sp. MC2016-05]MCX2472919.1 hypothetical protein [Pedobacter sp. MC2016-05]